MLNLPGELFFAPGQHQQQRLCVQRWLPRARRRAVRGRSERAVRRGALGPRRGALRAVRGWALQGRHRLGGV